MEKRDRQLTTSNNNVFIYKKKQINKCYDKISTSISSSHFVSSST